MKIRKRYSVSFVDSKKDLGAGSVRTFDEDELEILEDDDVREKT